jgi:hypothetical protein
MNTKSTITISSLVSIAMTWKFGFHLVKIVAGFPVDYSLNVVAAGDPLDSTGLSVVRDEAIEDPGLAWTSKTIRTPQATSSVR